MVTGIVLAGHGSHISPETAGIVWAQVDALRARQAADEIGAAFWKESPGFSRALHAYTADDITIVPLFTASGFFTRTLIPAEMGLDGALTLRDGRTIRYTPPIGEHHAYIARMIDQRISDALAKLKVTPDRVGVAVIGHGTRRDANSRATTFAQADRLRAAGHVAEVTAVFLDDQPSIPDAFTLLTTPYIIAVPNFLALGSHTTIDVPGALGLPRGVRTMIRDGRTVHYTDPIGAKDSLTEAILDLARASGMPAASGDPNYASGLPLFGRDGMMACLSPELPTRIGGLTVDGHWVCVGEQPVAELDDLTMLRDYVRTRPQFRPLAFSDDLPGSWRIAVRSLEESHAVIETVYPGLVGETQIFATGTAPTPVCQTITRQVGAFRALSALTPEQVDAVVETTCTGCVCCPMWHEASRAKAETDHGKIPCLEACNWWLSQALASTETTPSQDMQTP